MKKKNEKKDNLMIVLMILCVLLSLTTLGIVAYDKLINTDSTNNVCK